MSSQKMTYLSKFSMKDQIRSEDVKTMRAAFWEDTNISEEEACYLFSLNDKYQSQNADWIMFFIEALTEYCVNQSQPKGYVTEDNVYWLISKIQENRRVEPATELMLLIRIIETARQVPQTLVLFILEKIKDGVLAGDGPLRLSTDLRPGVIDATEVELIRRVLYSVGGDENVSISKVEAEFLFDLNEHSVEEQNDPSWQKLYVKAVTSYLMAASGYEPVERDEVIRREAWLAEHGTAWGFMRKMLNFSTWSNTSADLFEGMRFDRMERQAEKSRQGQNEDQEERISEEEANWLYAQIQADNIVSKNEKQMLLYLTRMSDYVPRNLKNLLHAA